jgi:hypothetical protein
MLDTGFAGTIPARLGMKCLLMSHANKQHGIQVFPCLKMARELALKIEYSPKYWDSARLENGKIVMRLADAPAFIAAAQLTMNIYRDSTKRIVSYTRQLTLQKGAA